MADELSAAHAYWDTVLKASGAVTALVANRIHADIAPEPKTKDQQVFPCIVYHLHDSQDKQNIRGEVVFAQMTFLVRAIGKSGYGELSAIFAALDNAGGTQNNYPIQVGGTLYNLKVTRARTFEKTEIVSGVIYRHRGAFYSMWVEVLT